MADNFGNTEPGLSSPASKHRAVTPSDSTILDPMPRAIVALTAGNVVIQDGAGTSVTYPVLAGDRLDFRAYRIMAATTATVVAWE